MRSPICLLEQFFETELAVECKIGIDWIFRRASFLLWRRNIRMPFSKTFSVHALTRPRRHKNRGRHIFSRSLFSFGQTKPWFLVCEEVGSRQKVSLLYCFVVDWTLTTTPTYRSVSSVCVDQQSISRNQEARVKRVSKKRKNINFEVSTHHAEEERERQSQNSKSYVVPFSFWFHFHNFSFSFVDL